MEQVPLVLRCSPLWEPSVVGGAQMPLLHPSTGGNQLLADLPEEAENSKSGAFSVSLEGYRRTATHPSLHEETLVPTGSPALRSL